MRPRQLLFREVGAGGGAGGEGRGEAAAEGRALSIDLLAAIIDLEIIELCIIDECAPSRRAALAPSSSVARVFFCAPRSRSRCVSSLMTASESCRLTW